ncbi:MAG: hypothetical protein DME00_32265 [Candidatus Rokuibacteriota bacterium]|nr:MAG: hypothetical protein DME00_32265 [Candidatus Rokubacteria bacterium]
MKSEESLRTLIQGKLVSGVLPGQDCAKVLGGPSNGETCDACRDTVEKNQLVMECVGEHYPKTLQFHVRCFYIWDSERRTLGDEPACPSAPAE